MEVIVALNALSRLIVQTACVSKTILFIQTAVSIKFNQLIYNVIQHLIFRLSAD